MARLRNNDQTLEVIQTHRHRLPKSAELWFKLYLDNKKKEARAIQKIPRKIIRDFINACNSFDETRLFKSLDERIVYERRLHWRTVLKTEGLDGFKNFLHSEEQQFCNKNFKIRSSWNFILPRVTIGVKYFPLSSDPDKQSFQKYGQIEFLLEGNKIIQIIDQS